MSEFKQKLAERAEKVECLICSFLPQEKGYQEKVFQAVNYSVRAGGKRVRPIIMSEVCDLCGGTDVAALGPFMAALEMIHTYSPVTYTHLTLPTIVGV